MEVRVFSWAPNSKPLYASTAAFLVLRSLFYPDPFIVLRRQDSFHRFVAQLCHTKVLSAAARRALKAVLALVCLLRGSAHSSSCRLRAWVLRPSIAIASTCHNKKRPGFRAGRFVLGLGCFISSAVPSARFAGGGPMCRRCPIAAPWPRLAARSRRAMGRCAWSAVAVAARGGR